jgi:dTDP-4-amino-4,6-dideoxygalactose transaminase
MIPFNKPYLSEKSFDFIAEAHKNMTLGGDGAFTKRCSDWIESTTGTPKALLTHSCTGALEMAALLLGIEQGDEVIMPSFTFVSTANAFVLRGAVPVFIDIREDTLNLDESLIESAITPRTRAIVAVHYAGVSCEMDAIMRIARKHGLKVVEDAAQGVMATYKGRALGAIGDFGTYSFHETKNLISGEGGALLVNDSSFVALAEVIREKGTDRKRFHDGAVDKYTWQEAGSSFLPGEITAAVLWSQLQEAEKITADRIESWCRYHEGLLHLEETGVLRRPVVPEECRHNGHLYYVLLSPEFDRGQILRELRRNGVGSVFHYVPLHSSPAGIQHGRVHGDMTVTVGHSERLIRLPLWFGLSNTEQDRVLEILGKALE